jgi:SNF2 family DNA or RNA helicase
MTEVRHVLGSGSVVSQASVFGAEGLEVASAKQREAANAAAVALAQRLELDGCSPTLAEREVLLMYSGVGGTNTAQEATGGNTLGLLNEYYTPMIVARAIWRLLERFGMTFGSVLEPSAGTGVFLESAPMGARVTAVELNPDAARINRLLHPGVDVRTSSFEADQSETGELDHDLVIGNPPFGPRGLGGLEDGSPWTSYAPYFVDAGLSRLRDGGLLAFVLPSGLMDSKVHLGFRAHVLARARLRALVRLPVTTFEASGARAATDVVVLEKRPWIIGDTMAMLLGRFTPQVLASAGLVDAATLDFLRGSFFESHPECVLGELRPDSRWGGLACVGPLDEEVLERLVRTQLFDTPIGPTHLGVLLGLLERSEVLRSMLEGSHESVRGVLETAWKRARATGFPHAEGKTRADGEVFKYFRADGLWRRGWRSRVELPPAIESALKVADQLAALQADAKEESRIAALDGLRAHVTMHGSPHEGMLLATAARAHPTLYRVLGAIKADGRIAPFLLEPINTNVERSTDLAALCERLEAVNNLTLKTLLERWEGGSRREANTALIDNDEWALLPDGHFTRHERYATGHVLEKAALARAQAEQEVEFDVALKLLRQAERLEALIPHKPFEEFDCTGTEGWIPTELVRDWLEQDYPYLEYNREQATGRVTIIINSERAREERVGMQQADEDQKELARFFNLEHVAKIVTNASRLNTERYAAARKARIEEAQSREARLSLKFRHFVIANVNWREALEREYNTLFNGFVDAPDNLSPLELSSWHEPRPHGYQNHGVRFALERSNSLLAFDTGLGKTLTGTAIIESWLQLKRAARVMVVVPKGLMVNWARTIERAIPFRRIVCVGITARGDEVLEDELGAVLEKLHELALGAFEIALVSREWFRRLRLRSKNLKHLINDEALLLASDKPDEADDEADTPTARERTLTLAERQTLLFERMLQANPLPQIHFEDLGIDALLVDEAGSLKNLYTAPTYFGKKPKFMGASLESDQALDTMFKVKTLHANNGGRNVVYLTATPTKNSPLELFNILKPLADTTFSRLGILGPAQFIERYCLIETVLFPNPAGVLEAIPGVVGFKNLHELRGLIAQFILVRDAVQVGLRIPELETVEHVFDLTLEQKAAYIHLRREAQIALNNPGGDHGIHLFSVYAQMRLLTLEPSLYSVAFDVNPRFRHAAQIAVDAIRDGGKVVCFLDVGSASDGDSGSTKRKKRDGLNAYDLLKKAMVHAGIPADWIAIVTASRVKGSDRQRIADDYNAGKLRIIIGSTGTIGEGFDLQLGTTDLIHLDMPWDPGTFHQRVGRGHRQGNDVARLHNHILLARGSFDGLTYAMMRGKRGWQDQLWGSHEDRVRNSAVLSYDEVLAALSDDPDAARRDIEAKRLDIEAQKREARRQLSLNKFKLYLETLDHQSIAWRKARGRKNGPTPSDHRLRERMEQQLERYRHDLRSDSSFEHAWLLDGRCCLINAHGAILASGMAFDLESRCTNQTWCIEEVMLHDDESDKRIRARTLEGDQIRVFKAHELEDVTSTRVADREPVPLTQLN